MQITEHQCINGTEKLQYFVSGGYSDEQGIVEKAHFNRYNFRANLDSEQTKWLKTVSYTHLDVYKRQSCNITGPR